MATEQEGETGFCDGGAGGRPGHRFIVGQDERLQWIKGGKNTVEKTVSTSFTQRGNHVKTRQSGYAHAKR